MTRFLLAGRSHERASKVSDGVIGVSRHVRQAASSDASVSAFWNLISGRETFTLVGRNPKGSVFAVSKIRIAQRILRGCLCCSKWSVAERCRETERRECFTIASGLTLQHYTFAGLNFSVALQFDLELDSEGYGRSIGGLAGTKRD